MLDRHRLVWSKSNLYKANLLVVLIIVQSYQKTNPIQSLSLEL